MRFAAILVALTAGTAHAGNAGKLAASFDGLIGLGGEYVKYDALALEVGYHFSDTFGVELTGMKTLVDYSSLVYEVYDIEYLTPRAVDIKQMDYAGFASLEATPIFGLASFYGAQLDYFFYLTAGFGVVSTLETCAFDRGDCSGDVGIGQGLHPPELASDRYKLASTYSLGFHVSAVGVLGFHLGVRGIVYSDRAVGTDGVTSTGVFHIGFLDLGLGLLL